MTELNRSVRSPILRRYVEGAQTLQATLAELKRRREEIDAEIRRLEGDKAREPKIETRGCLRGLYLDEEV